MLAASGVAVPDGFSIEVLTERVPGARQMAQSESGMLYVGSMRQGNLYAVVWNEDSLTEPEVVLVDSELDLPTGIALMGNDLYVAALNRILKYPDIDGTFRDLPEPVVVTDDLPSKRWHGWKYLSVGPDGFLYLNVGAPCNVCESDDSRFASIVRLDPATGEHSVHAHGVRNSVGSDWHPETGELWFSDNGRDMMGDDVPPEEINVAPHQGLHFGFPYLHGSGDWDPEHGKDRELSEFVLPQVEIQAHSAALGIAFYTGGMFPQQYRNALFIAEHGSWNRSSKVGYRVSVVTDNAGTLAYSPFIDIWLKDDVASGRPNDVLVALDGSLLISDDYGGRVFRVSYQAAKSDSTP